jgi:formamidopyrimidine-DNA glycosylase
MPELPEAHTIASDLNASLTGLSISSVRISDPNVLGGPYSPDLISDIPITGVERLGKMIIFRFEEDVALLTTLRMTGQFVWEDRIPPKERGLSKARAAFTIRGEDGLLNGQTLLFRDVRKFGRLYFLPGKDLKELIKRFNLGPDALAISPEDLMKMTAAHRLMPIKSLLMNQHVIAGIGNIYSTESLFSARLTPFRLGESIRKEDAKKLHRNIHKVLNSAIENRGSTVANYTAPNGEGTFQNFHRVYGRARRPCRICRNPLAIGKISGRVTVYCKKCQN